MDHLVSALLADQTGVVARRQLVALGAVDHDIARWVRRRRLVAVHRGVYVDHTGSLSWEQRAWAGVLFAWPAPLTHESALRAAEVSRSGAPVPELADAPGGPVGGPAGGSSTAARLPLVHVAIAERRRVRSMRGVEVHRVVDFDRRVLWNVGPPRFRYDEAVVDVAAAAGSDLAALGVLSRAVQQRRTTAERLLRVIASRARLARREWLVSVLCDVAEGACSVLEHGYLTRVERAHGLATARRQVAARTRGGVAYRDVEYDGGLVVELDGRLFHDTTEQRDRDLDRDLVTAAQGGASVRLSWGQVFNRPCWTAGLVGHLLTARGWAGAVRPCGQTCTARRALAA